MIWTNIPIGKYSNVQIHSYQVFDMDFSVNLFWISQWYFLDLLGNFSDVLVAFSGFVGEFFWICQVLLDFWTIDYGIFLDFSFLVSFEQGHQEQSQAGPKGRQLDFYCWILPASSFLPGCKGGEKVGKCWKSQGQQRQVIELKNHWKNS